MFNHAWLLPDNHDINPLGLTASIALKIQQKSPGVSRNSCTSRVPFFQRVPTSDRGICSGSVPDKSCVCPCSSFVTLHAGTHGVQEVLLTKDGEPCLFSNPFKVSHIMLKQDLLLLFIPLTIFRLHLLHCSSKETQLFWTHFSWWPWVTDPDSGSCVHLSTLFPKRNAIFHAAFLLKESVRVNVMMWSI